MLHSLQHSQTAISHDSRAGGKAGMVMLGCTEQHRRRTAEFGSSCQLLTLSVHVPCLDAVQEPVGVALEHLQAAL